MVDKKPHRRVPTSYGWDFKPVELTGRCKRVTYPSGAVFEYVECQRRLFGIKIGTFWEDKDCITWALETKVEYYDCNLTE